jgi:hypothetical protein
MKIRKIPTTIKIDPKTFFGVTRSCKKIIADSVEKRGVVEDIGTARDSKVFMKL